MEYDLYHDESKRSGYWHGMLLVPRPSRQILLDHLAAVRSNTTYQHPIKMNGIDKYTGPHYRSARAWLSIAVAALIQDFKKNVCHIYTGKDGRGAGVGEFLQLIGARFILFRVRDDHSLMVGYRDGAARVETTFRMGLKGGLHLFSKANNDGLLVKSFHFDGYKHYGRRLDSKRIVGRLGALRDGVAVAPDLLIDDDSSNHNRQECQNYYDCQLLQLTDLLVSGFRTILGEQTHDAQRQVSAPLQELAGKWKQGYARMKQSRWFGGFCISQCWLENGDWVFSDFYCQSREPDLFIPS